MKDKIKQFVVDNFFAIQQYMPIPIFAAWFFSLDWLVLILSMSSLGLTYAYSKIK